MKTRISLWNGVIVVEGHLWGPVRDYRLRLILDTGAAHTSLQTDVLRFVGYTPEMRSGTARIMTASSIELCGILPARQLAALGIRREDFPVYEHDLPAGARVHGLLGLDFLEGRKLCIDLREGFLELT